MNFFLDLFWIFLNHFITESVFFHCLSPVFSLTIVFIFAVICLLIFPISGFAGLINLHFVFWLKVLFVVFDSDERFPLCCSVHSVLKI